MIHVIDLEFLGIPHTIASFLIDSKDGPFLIETGPYSTFPRLEAGLQAHGYTPADVKHVLLTHIHLDHAGAAWAFAKNGAQIYMHPFGERHMENPEKLLSSARRIYQDMMDKLWGAMHPIPGHQITTPGDEDKVQIGEHEVQAIYSPGHAVHHIAWLLDDTLFTGDVAGVKIADGMVVPPCPPPDINIEDWDASIARIRELAPRRLYLTHFGEVTNVSEHLDELEERLHQWAAWMRPRYESGESMADITPAFEEMVRRQLADFGIDQAGIQKYEAANPPWMSVAGLLRYWKKKNA